MWDLLMLLVFALPIYFLLMILFFFVMLLGSSCFQLRLALTCFQAFTSLKVNVGKSEIALTGEVSNIQILANILQCRVGSLPMTYLGMPVGTSYKTGFIWNPILERMEKSFQAGSVFIRVGDSLC